MQIINFSLVKYRCNTTNNSFIMKNNKTFLITRVQNMINVNVPYVRGCALMTPAFYSTFYCTILRKYICRHSTKCRQ